MQVARETVRPEDLRGVGGLHDQVYLSQSVFQVVLQKSIPTQLCQLVLYISNSKERIGGFVGD